MKHLLGALLLLTLATSAQANTIDFTQLNISATNLFAGDGFTLSADDGATLSSALGEGLGLVGVGQDSSIDGTTTRHDGSRDAGSLNIHVDGRIDAMTIQPYETIDGAPATVPFEFGFQQHLTGVTLTGVYYYDVSPFTPFTVTLPERPAELNAMNLFADYGQINFYLYLIQHPDAVISYGFSILSVDYTPNVPTPEPPSLLLVGVCAALCTTQRKRLRHLAP